MSIHNPFPVHPRPLPGEWLGSWMFRLAHDNYIKASDILEEIQVQDGSQLSEAQVQHLAVLGTLNPPAVHQMQVLPSSVIESTGSLGGVDPVPLLGVRYCLVCPECLLQDQVPFFRQSWLDSTLAACPVHGISMSDACPHCGGRIIPPGYRVRTTRRSTSAQHRPQDDLRQCWDCEGDLAVLAAPVPMLQQPERLQTLPRWIGRMVAPSAAQWRTLHEALDRYISTCGLYRLYDPFTEIFGWGQLPSYFIRAHRERAMHRFSTRQLLLRVMCGRLGEQSSVQTRLQQFGQYVLSLSDLVVSQRHPTAAIHFTRQWLAQQLIDMSEREVLVLWPGLAHALLDAEDSPHPGARLSLLTRPTVFTAEQEQLLQPLLAEHVGLTRISSSQERTSFPAVLGAYLWMMASGQREQGMLRVSDLKYSQVRKRAESWEREGRLGIILGALSRHLRDQPVARQSEPWWQYTRAILESEGIIELSRHVNPALHRDLLFRVFC